MTSSQSNSNRETVTVATHQVQMLLCIKADYKSVVSGSSLIFTPTCSSMSQNDHQTNHSAKGHVCTIAHYTLTIPLGIAIQASIKNQELMFAKLHASKISSHRILCACISNFHNYVIVIIYLSYNCSASWAWGLYYQFIWRLQLHALANCLVSLGDEAHFHVSYHCCCAAEIAILQQISILNGYTINIS